MNITSLAAYAALRDSGATGTQQQRVLRALELCGPMTREEIHNITGIKLQSVCGRCNELMKAGKIRGGEVAPRKAGELPAELLRLTSKQEVSA